MELIERYFPEITVLQKEQIEALGPLYREWNEKINVVSRRDIEHLYEHHILHSLALVKYGAIEKGMHILDVGTGGGFPGIPLAIMHPDASFSLLDSTGKKIHVVNEIIGAINLKNAIGIHARAESYSGKFDLIVSRAVSTLTQLVSWTKHLTVQNRWLALKGGNPKEVRKELPPAYNVSFKAITDYFAEEYFREKWIVDVAKSEERRAKSEK